MGLAGVVGADPLFVIVAQTATFAFFVQTDVAKIYKGNKTRMEKQAQVGTPSQRSRGQQVRDPSLRGLWGSKKQFLPGMAEPIKVVGK